MPSRNAEKAKPQTIAGTPGEPELHISGGGNHLSANGDRDGEPVSRAGNESGPVIKVEVAIDAERTGSRMSAGQFAERQRDGPTDEGGKNEAQDHGGGGQFDGGRGTHRKSTRLNSTN